MENENEGSFTSYSGSNSKGLGLRKCCLWIWSSNRMYMQQLSRMYLIYCLSGEKGPVSCLLESVWSCFMHYLMLFSSRPWSVKAGGIPSFPRQHISLNSEMSAACLSETLPKHRLLPWEPCRFPVCLQSRFSQKPFAIRILPQSETV